MNRVVIHLHIDQPIPDGEDGLRIVNDYIDELAKTNGSLTWNAVDWDFFTLLPNATEEVSE
jgi:hypothetical protein